MASIKELAAKRITRKTKFMGGDVTISKLSVKEVKEIQELSKAAGEDEEQGFEILKHVISVAVNGADELEDSDFENIPLDELDRLSKEIMKFSGLGADSGPK